MTGIPMSFPDHTVYACMNWELCALKWFVLLLALTARVAVRNTALLCMLALVTEASLPVTGKSTRESADMRCQGQKREFCTSMGPSSVSFENVWEVVTIHLNSCSHQGFACQQCAAHRVGWKGSSGTGLMEESPNTHYVRWCNTALVFCHRPSVHMVP